MVVSTLLHNAVYSNFFLSCWTSDVESPKVIIIGPHSAANQGQETMGHGVKKLIRIYSWSPISNVPAESCRYTIDFHNPDQNS